MNIHGVGSKIIPFGLALIFCAVGAALGWGAISGAIQDNGDNVLVMAIAAVIFGGVGVAVLLIMRSGFKLAARLVDLRAAHPE